MIDFVSHLDITDEAKAMLVVAAVDVLRRAPKAWTERDVALLREHYPGGGVKAVSRHLPQRTAGAIYEKAKQLGVKAGPTRNHLFRYSNAPHIDDAIRQFYRQPKAGGLSKLAHRLNRPRSWLSARARYLGVTVPRVNDGPWSETESALLAQHAHRVPYNISRIFAKHGFRRSSSAIRNKLMKLHCDRSDDGTYSAEALAKLFGVDGHLVCRWIEKRWLKAGKRGTARENDVYRIHHKAVRRFIIEHIGSIDIRRVEKQWFVDLVAGA